MNLFDLTGRTIVVTGGAGHLGRPICMGLASSGARVICLSSKELILPPKEGRSEIKSIVCDIQDEAAFEASLPERVHGLVNCAVRAPRRPDLDMSRAAFNAAFDTICTHYFTCSRIAAKRMLRGSIVNVASMWGNRSPDLATYLDLENEPSLAMSAGAGAILGLTRYMATLMAPKYVRVNALIPGWFPKQRGPNRADYIAEIEKRVPMARIGGAHEIVGPTLFLLSDASSYMTGQQLIIDGGASIV